MWVRHNVTVILRSFVMASSTHRSNRLNTVLQDSVTCGSSNIQTMPPKKRQKITTPDKPKAKPRGKHGALEMLTDMPIDILFEVSTTDLPAAKINQDLQIFSHLLPLDLLNLARTTKALRGLLMQRAATGVWKSARGNLPHATLYLNPPDDMSEPAYTRLLFDTHCHVSHIYFPELRARSTVLLVLS